MSGLEVLGVVIGGLPLVITSVQACKPRYQSAKDKDRDMAKVLQEISDTLKRLDFILRKDLEIIVSSSSLSKERVAEILHQPHVVYFRDKEVMIAMRKALGNGYEVYISTVKRCGEVVMNLAGRLAGSKDSQPVRHKPILKRKELGRILEQIDHSTVLLARLQIACGRPSKTPLVSAPAHPEPEAEALATTPGPKSEPGPTPSPPVSSLLPLDVIKENADRLYGAIASGFNSDCRHSHSAAIFLQTGRDMIGGAQKGASSSPPITFTVGLRLSGFEERFYVAAVKVAPNMTSGQVEITNDLCQVITLFEETGGFIKMNLSKEGHLSYQKPQPDAQTRPIISNFTSLNTVLRHCAPGAWTIPQKVHLSFIIVSSIMQLCPTHWTSEAISSGAIFFIPDDAHMLTGTGPKPRRSSSSRANHNRNPDTNPDTFDPNPLILRTIPSLSDTRRSSLSSAARPGARFALLETAILLLEIWHQRPFEWYARGSGTPLRNAFWSRLKVAYEWLESSESKSILVGFVSDIITRCIHCTFETEVPVADWDDAVFRRSFFNKVVVPLWRNDGTV